MTPAQAAAHMSILHTMAVYHTAIDSGDFAGMAMAFTEDAVLHLTRAGPFVGREAIGDALSARRRERIPADGRHVFQRHNLTTRRIDLAGLESAACLSYYMVVTELGLDHCGSYVDTFRPVGEDWLIAVRRSQVEWMHAQSRFAVNAKP